MENPARAVRPQKFSHQLLSPEFLASTKMDQAIIAISRAKQWAKKVELADAEWTALYIFILSAYRRPRDFLGGPHKQNFSLQASGKLCVHDVQDYFKSSGQTVRTLDQIPGHFNFLEQVCNRTFRSIPISVQKSLSAWAKAEYPLRLRDDIPEAHEVMRMQSEGFRCVSVLTQPEQMRTYLEDGRDVLGFVVHDLIHADHFFRDSENARAQIQFSRLLLKLNESPYVVKLVALDRIFANEWTYITSDMNSVPLHLFKSLKALFLMAAKRKQGLSMRESLHPEAELEFQKLILAIGKEMGLDEAQSDAWMRLNGSDFSMPQDAYTLQGALHS